jgi:tripartite-type tricarboxylate transporter receptor subunit TctC
MQRAQYRETRLAARRDWPDVGGAWQRAHRARTTDILALALAPELQRVFGQPFVIENKPGAGGNLGPAEFAWLIDAESKKWAQVVKASGAKVD